MVLCLSDEHIETVNTLTILKIVLLYLSFRSYGYNDKFLDSQLGGQKYAMTGMTMNWTLEASQTGTFRGRNSSFNGEGFSSNI